MTAFIVLYDVDIHNSFTIYIIWCLYIFGVECKEQEEEVKKNVCENWKAKCLKYLIFQYADILPLYTTYPNAHPTPLASTQQSIDWIWCCLDAESIIFIFTRIYVELFSPLPTSLCVHSFSLHHTFLRYTHTHTHTFLLYSS